jgi:hypothetical protein
LGSFHDYFHNLSENKDCILKIMMGWQPFKGVLDREVPRYQPDNPSMSLRCLPINGLATFSSDDVPELEVTIK